MKKLNSYLLILVTCLGLNSCSVPTSPEPPTWDLELYGPLSLVTVGLSDLFSGEVFTYGTSFSPKDLGLDTPVPFPIAPFQGLNLDDIDTVITQDFLSVTLGSAILNISVINNWPINIKSGSKITLFNDQMDTLAGFTLDKNIDANGGVFNRDIYVENVIYTARMIIRFENFGSDGSNGVPVQLADQKLEFLFTPREMDIHAMTITDNREIPYTEANDFTLTGERIKTLGVTGKFFTKFSNPHPFSFTNQSYMMKKDSIIIDSIFNGTQLILGTEGQTVSGSCPNLVGDLQTDIQATNEVPVISRDTIDLNVTRLNNMNSAQIVQIKGYVCLPINPDNSGKWVLDNTNLISLKIIGDVKMHVDLGKDD